MHGDSKSTINIIFCSVLNIFLVKRFSMWQLEIQLFSSPFIKLAHYLKVNYSTLVTWVSKKSSADQSGFEK